MSTRHRSSCLPQTGPEQLSGVRPPSALTLDTRDRRRPSMLLVVLTGPRGLLVSAADHPLSPRSPASSCLLPSPPRPGT